VKTKPSAQQKAFRESLETAVGVSSQIIIVFADVRGFSNFSKGNDATDVAEFVRSVYLRIIESFPFADFYKTTGDGLLITIPYRRSDLKEKAAATVKACLDIVENFATFCAGDPMVNFDVPQHVGFGIVRGSACRLVSGDAIVDYSGHRLNLAARLMDLARPDGVVIDHNFDTSLLDESTRKLFTAESAYVRSLAEEIPISIQIQTERVILPDYAKYPLSIELWETIEEKKSIPQWRLSGPLWGMTLPKSLKRPDGVRLRYSFPVLKKAKPTGLRQSRDYSEFKLQQIGNETMVVIDLSPMLKSIKENKLPLATEVAMTLHYVPIPGKP
jgi:class 3 adenylate cyclase